MSKWCNEVGNEQRDFDSVALFAETRLLEAIEQTEQLGVPNRVLALKCCEVIEESAVVYCRFSTYLRLALHHLIPCIFSGREHAPPSTHSARMCELPDLLRGDEGAVAIGSPSRKWPSSRQGLGSAKARSKIFAFIFKNVFRTVLRLLFRGWKQIIAQKVGRIIGFQKRSYYRWFFVWRTVMRQRRALSLQAAILNKKNEELMFEEKEEPEEEQENQVVIKEVIVEKKVETATVEVQTDRVVISEYVEPPKITVSTIQKLKSRGKKAKQVEEKEEEVLPLHKGMELVTLVYEEKLQQDIRDEGKHIEPQDLKQFCRDVLIRKYGIQSLAKKNMRALLASTREGAGRSNKRLQLFSELLALKPKDLPPDTPAPQYMPEMVDIFAKLLRNLWGATKGTLTSCFQAVTPTVNCAHALQGREEVLRRRAVEGPRRRAPAPRAHRGAAADDHHDRQDGERRGERRRLVLDDHDVLAGEIPEPQGGNGEGLVELDAHPGARGAELLEAAPDAQGPVQVRARAEVQDLGGRGAAEDERAVVVVVGGGGGGRGGCRS